MGSIQEFDNDEYDEEHVFMAIHDKRLKMILETIYDDPDIFDNILKSIMNEGRGSVVNGIIQQLTDLGCVCKKFDLYYTTDLGDRMMERIRTEEDRNSIWFIMCNCNPMNGGND